VKKNFLKATTMILSKRGKEMLGKKIGIILTVGILMFPSVVNSLTLKEYLEEVERSNPKVLSSYESYRAKESLILPSGWLDNPTVSVRKMFMEDAYGFTQPVPFPVKLLKKRKISEYEAEKGFEDYRLTLLEVKTRAKILFFEYAYLEKAIEVTRENIENLKEILDVARRKYETGGDIWEPLRTEVEIAQLENQLAVLESKKRSIRAELNSLRNKDPEEEIGDITLPNLEEIELPDKETLREIALSEQPALRSHLSLIKKTEERVSLSLWSLAPDFVPQILYQPKLEEYKFSLGVRIPLWFPLKQIQETKSLKRALSSKRAMYEDMTNSVLKELEKALAEWDAAITEYKNFRDIIVPSSREALRVAEAGYIAGRLDFLNLLNSEITYLLSEISLWRAYIKLGKTIALIESIIGKEIWSKGEGL
jgi:outer membrane protein TolC